MPRNQKGTARLVSWAAPEPHDPGVHIMKRLLLITVGSCLVASVALAQTPPASTSAPSAQEFVNKVAISDMFEIQSSQLALSKQADADTKPFAEKMVQDHQKTSSELKGLVEGSMVKLTLPISLDAEHQQLLNELSAKSGKDFDQTYDQIQVKAHGEAVALFEAYSKSGEDSELKTWAGKTLPHLKEHLSMAEKLK
jgi:putative membrane protein